MTKQDFIDKMNALDSDDPEHSHVVADELLCDFLALNGHGDLAKAWSDAADRCGFWFA